MKITKIFLIGLLILQILQIGCIDKIVTVPEISIEAKVDLVETGLVLGLFIPIENPNMIGIALEDIVIDVNNGFYRKKLDGFELKPHSHYELREEIELPFSLLAGVLSETGDELNIKLKTGISLFLGSIPITVNAKVLLPEIPREIPEIPLSVDNIALKDEGISLRINGDLENPLPISLLADLKIKVISDGEKLMEQSIFLNIEGNKISRIQEELTLPFSVLDARDLKVLIDGEVMIPDAISIPIKSKIDVEIPDINELVEIPDIRLIAGPITGFDIKKRTIDLEISLYLKNTNDFALVVTRPYLELCTMDNESIAIAPLESGSTRGGQIYHMHSNLEVYLPKVIDSLSGGLLIKFIAPLGVKGSDFRFPVAIHVPVLLDLGNMEVDIL